MKYLVFLTSNDDNEIHYGETFDNWNDARSGFMTKVDDQGYAAAADLATERVSGDPIDGPIFVKIENGYTAHIVPVLTAPPAVDDKAVQDLLRDVNDMEYDAIREIENIFHGLASRIKRL